MGSPSWPQLFALLLCAALTEVAVAPPRSQGEAKKVIPATQAKQEWLKHKKLKCTVAPRVLEEHFTHYNSANQALAAAKDRFERNHNIVKKGKKGEISGRLSLVPLSWTDVTEASLRNKANGAAPATKRATVFRNQQQMCHRIDGAGVRTVEVTEVSAAQGNQLKNVETYYHKDLRRDVFIHFENRDVARNMYITGDWEPRTGACVLYHYEANPPQQDEMLDEYRKFWTLDGGRTITTPVTKEEL